MTRQITPYVIARLREWEGVVLYAYDDADGKRVPVGGRARGVLTIGVGHTGPDVVPGQVITDARATELMLIDLTRFQKSVETSVKVSLNDNQYGALVSFAYNVGVGAFQSSTLLKLLNSGQYSAVPGQLARWNKDNGAVVDGLTKRRAKEAVLWNKAA